MYFNFWHQILVSLLVFSLFFLPLGQKRPEVNGYNQWCRPNAAPCRPLLVKHAPIRKKNRTAANPLSKIGLSLALPQNWQPCFRFKNNLILRLYTSGWDSFSEFPILRPNKSRTRCKECRNSEFFALLYQSISILIGPHRVKNRRRLVTLSKFFKK